MPEALTLPGLICCPGGSGLNGSVFGIFFGSFACFFRSLRLGP